MIVILCLSRYYHLGNLEKVPVFQCFQFMLAGLIIWGFWQGQTSWHGECGRSKLGQERKGRKKGPEFQYTLQGHGPNDLTSYK
jgi:hypothetical protein